MTPSAHGSTDDSADANPYDSAGGSTDDLIGLVDTRTRALLAALDDLDDDAVHEPTRLPSWTRGHLLTHLARSADAMRNAFRWVATGDPTPMYSSVEARTADIEAGAARPARALLQDLRTSADRWQEAATSMPDEAWAGTWRRGFDPRELPGTWIPVLRLGEIELHWFDLDLRSSPHPPATWPASWVGLLLPDAALDLEQRSGEPVALRCTDTGRSIGPATGRTIVGTQSGLLAWVTGRSDGTDLVTDPGGDLPALGPWR